MSFQAFPISVADHNRRSTDYFLQTVFAAAKQAVTIPLTCMRTTLWGQYTSKQDFISRYQWTTHHVRILHQWINSPGFWIKWTQIGDEIYLQIHHELSMLRRFRARIQAIYIQINRPAQQEPPKAFSNRAIACLDFSPLEKQLRDIRQQICRVNGQAYVDKSQENLTDIRNTIADLNATRVTASWNEWFAQYRATCISIQSRINDLKHTSYLYVIENEDQMQKLDGLRIGELQTLFSNTLRGIALKHYVYHVSNGYQALYREVESELTLLRNDRTTYHKSWGNYLWSQWESSHHTQATSLHLKIYRLVVLYQEYSKTVQLGQDICLPPTTSLQVLFRAVFRSFQAPDAISFVPYPLACAVPEEWKTIRHRGLPISCGEPVLGNALQLMFSDPILAKLIFKGPRQIEPLGKLYNSYMDAQWSAQWTTIGNFIQTVDPTKPISFNQFVHCLDRLYGSHPENRWYLTLPFYNLIGDVVNRTSDGLISAFLSRLDQEKSPLFYTLIHHTVNTIGVIEERQTKRAGLHFDCTGLGGAETLERLLECQFDTPQEKTYFTNPPEYLFIFLHRDGQSTDSLVGVQERFFLLGRLTVSTKGVSYEIVSFTSSKVHYRKTDFGYTRIDNANACVENISQLDFLIAAQSCTDCVFRLSSAELTEKQLTQEAYNNRLRYMSLQYKIRAIRSTYGYSNFEVPATYKNTLQHLVEFIHLVATGKSFVTHVLETAFHKNPNDDLEQAFNKLPTELQILLWKVWKSADGTTIKDKTALLRDLRTDILLSANSGALSIPPLGNEQQYDQDRFVLTLMADRLVKHFEWRTEEILKSGMENFLFQGTLHAISEVVRAKRIRLIRYSGAAEESIHLAVTLVFSNLLGRGEELLARQAISSGARLITVIADPFHDKILFRRALQIATTIVLLGQSLDNPDLSEENIRHVGIQFFARQGLALVPSGHVPQPLKEFVISTFSAMLFQNPSHLINWGVSASFDLINTALVEDLPPDIPQSPLNFYAARFLNPLLTNAALQTYTSEKVTEATLRLLSSVEDSDPVLEAPSLLTKPLEETKVDTHLEEEAVADTPLETQAQIDQLPKPDLIHNEYYINTSHSFRVHDNQGFQGVDYGKFNSLEEAQKFIHELKGVHLADNSRKLTIYNLKVKALLLGISPEKLPIEPQFTQLSLSLEVTDDSVKLYNGTQRIFKVSKGTVKKEPMRFKKGITEARTHAHTHNTTNDTRLQSYESEVRALFPTHIMAPEPVQKVFPIIKHTNTVCTLTPSGEVADRVTFGSRDQAESVREFQASHEVDIYVCQTIRFEMEKQVVEQGVAIEVLPGCGSFVQTQLQVEARGNHHFSLRVNGKTAHTFTGSNAFTNLETQLSDYRTTDRGANQRTLSQHHTNLATLTTEPITQVRFSQTERVHILRGMLPSVKAEKEHGAWFNGWRQAKMAGSNGVQWLRDIGLAGASVNVVQSEFNAPHTPHSTPNHSAPYGLDPVGPSFMQTTSIAHGPSFLETSPIDTQPSPYGQQPFIPPTIDTPTFGPQNPFLPKHPVSPHQATLPLLPPRLISRQEIAARADLYQEGAGALPFFETPLLLSTTPMKTTERVSPLHAIVRGIMEHLQHNGLFPKTSNIHSGITTTRNVIQVDTELKTSNHQELEPVKFPEAQLLIDRLSSLKSRIATFGREFQKPSTPKKTSATSRPGPDKTRHLNQGTHSPPTDTANISGDTQVTRLVFELPTLEQLDAVHKIFTSDFAKSFPKGPIETLKAVCALMLPDMSDIPGAEDPREHLNRVYDNAIKKYDSLLHIKDPNSFESRSAVFLSGGLSFGALGKIIRTAETSILMVGCEGALFGVIMAEANDTNKVAGGVFGFACGGALSKLLPKIPIPKTIRNRKITHAPTASSRELQFLDTINQPSYHSGISLGKRSVIRIKPVKMPYVERGPELEWWREACPRIDQLRSMKGADKFDQFLRATFKRDYPSELQIRRVLTYSGFETYPRPQGLPSNCIVEFTKENGGMIYRKWATRSNENMVIRIMPKNPKSLNPVQQRPYVVQTTNRKYLTTDGKWVEKAGPSTHIPLEKYEFKGWE